MGWEGVMDRFGSCAGSCTHVWNYEMATPFLFGDLARSMRDVEFNYNGSLDIATLTIGKKSLKNKKNIAEGETATFTLK